MHRLNIVIFTLPEHSSKCFLPFFLRIWSHLLKKSLMKNFIFFCNAKYTISKQMNLKRKNSWIFALIKSFELLVLMIVLWIFIFQMERKEKIKYFQSYQVNLVNHLTHLNLIAIEKASQNEISLSTCAPLFTLSLLFQLGRKVKCIKFCGFREAKSSRTCKTFGRSDRGMS